MAAVMEALHLWCAGIRDALSFHLLWKVAKSSGGIRHILVCMAMNAVLFLGSILVFQVVVLPLALNVLGFAQVSIPVSSVPTAEYSNLNSLTAWENSPAPLPEDSPTPLPDVAQTDHLRQISPESVAVAIHGHLSLDEALSREALGTLHRNSVVSFRLISFFEQLIPIVFYVAWLYPMYLVWLVFGGIWHAELAEKAYLVLHKEEASAHPKVSWHHWVATELVYRAVVGVFVTLQVKLLSYIPLFGPVFLFFGTAFIFSFQFFEFVWLVEQIPLSARMHRVERAWPYYAGFGAPVALLCVACPGILGAGVVMSLLVLFIVLATGAEPIGWKDSSRLGWVPDAVEIFYFPRVASDTMINWMLNRKSEKAGRS